MAEENPVTKIFKIIMGGAILWNFLSMRLQYIAGVYDADYPTTLSRLLNNITKGEVEITRS
jgi:hypothetical protein